MTEAQQRAQARKRERWKRENKCMAHGNVKPCDKCATNLRALKIAKGRIKTGWCDECLCGGGLHRHSCPL